MKIALCLEYSIEQFGGTEILVRELIEGLSGRHEIVLVSPDDAAAIKNSSVAAKIRGHIQWQPQKVSAANSRELAQKLWKEGVQLAHFHMGGNYGWGNRFPNQSPIVHMRRVGIPCCSTVHSVVHVLDGFCGPDKPLVFKLAMLPIAWTGKMQSLAHLRREIAVSKYGYDKLRRWYFPLRNKFTQIYHSRLKGPQPTIRPEQREPIILNVGHIAARKGQLVLVEAFIRLAEKYPTLKLRLIGPIEEARVGDEIRRLAQKNKLEERISLPGSCNDVSPWMDLCAIYVQPSLNEALGLALQEAMFRGCPCIGTRVGGIPELIEHEKTGLLVESANPAQLAQAMDLLLQDPARRERYAAAGAAFVREQGMTSEQMIANHIRLYESIVRG